MAECLHCKHTYVLKDNHGKYHSVCLCVESDAFLHPIDIVFGGCECGEPEGDDGNG